MRKLNNHSYHFLALFSSPPPIPLPTEDSLTGVRRAYMVAMLKNISKGVAQHTKIFVLP